MLLLFKGEKYNGFDGDEHIFVSKGQQVKVSNEKAKQLLSDFPEQWEEVKATSGSKKSAA